MTFSPRSRVETHQSTSQTASTSTTRPSFDALDDVLPSNNPALDEIDDFWNQRMSQYANDYLDDIYKSIDDSLGLGW